MRHRVRAFICFASATVASGVCIVNDLLFKWHKHFGNKDGKSIVGGKIELDFDPFILYCSRTSMQKAQ